MPGWFPGMKYDFIQKIGQGKFGQVFLGKHYKSGDHVAIKMEPIDGPRVLKHETMLLNHLYAKSCRNIPPVLDYGRIGNYTYLVVPYYAKCEIDYCSFMRSAIRILENIHRRFVVHRDIKPDNWMRQGNEMVLIDFGLATFYVDDREHHILPNPEPKMHIVGTPKYASIRIHEGWEYTRRDDLISLAYIGVNLSGTNPLQSGTNPLQSGTNPLQSGTNPLPRTHVLHPNNILLQESKSLDRLTLIHDPLLIEYIKQVYSLRFDETPDYEALSNIFATKPYK